jgi:hypothetical protein
LGFLRRQNFFHPLQWLALCTHTTVNTETRRRELNVHFATCLCFFPLPALLCVRLISEATSKVHRQTHHDKSHISRFVSKHETKTPTGIQTRRIKRSFWLLRLHVGHANTTSIRLARAKADGARATKCVSDVRATRLGHTSRGARPNTRRQPEKKQDL